VETAATVATARLRVEAEGVEAAAVKRTISDQGKCSGLFDHFTVHNDTHGWITILKKGVAHKGHDLLSAGNVVPQEVGHYFNSGSVSFDRIAQIYFPPA
jgi:hypothetical protein